MLIYMIIAAVLLVILFFLISWAGGVISDYINEITNGQFGDWGDIISQYQNGEISNIPDISAYITE